MRTIYNYLNLVISRLNILLPSYLLHMNAKAHTAHGTRHRDMKEVLDTEFMVVRDLNIYIRDRRESSVQKELG